MFLGELSADGYGFALLDVRDLSEFLKERKCRAKKLLSYWDAHKQLFYDARGAVVVRERRRDQGANILYCIFA